MLTDYQQRVRFMLADESFARFNDYTIARWCNEARGQIAGESECIVNYATLAVVAGTDTYPFSAIQLSPGTSGVQGVLNVRKASWTLPDSDTGQVRMTSRDWVWFQNFVLTQTPQTPGAPRYWSQLGQGAAGSLVINRPDGPYQMFLDTVCYPAPLVTDTDTEALPYPWTDAVPYYATYLAYVHAQDADRAKAAMQLFQGYMERARAAATPSVMPHQYRQGPDAVLANRLGMPAARGQ